MLVIGTEGTTRKSLGRGNCLVVQYLESSLSSEPLKRVPKARELTLCFTLSSESGVSTEKPIKMTCALEYARGRNRS